MLKDGEYPAGCRYIPPRMRSMNVKEANQKDHDDLVDEEQEDIIKLEESALKSYGNYIMRFKPNKSVYKKCAKALLILNDLSSPIKDIITSEMSTIDPKMNKVSN